MAKVLLIDDDLVYLDELSEGLRSLSHDVVCAASIAEGLTYFRAEPFDIAICDTIMEGGGALSLLHEIRKTDATFPFVVITGRPEIATSPLFTKGMSEASAKLEKSASLFEIDRTVRALVQPAAPAS